MRPIHKRPMFIKIVTPAGKKYPVNIGFGNSKRVFRKAAVLINHQTVQCQICFRWLLRKRAIFHQIDTGCAVPLCPWCDRAIFRPFTRQQLN